MRIFKDMELVEQLGSGVCKYTNLTDEGARSNPDNVQPNKFDAIVLGVAHKEFLNLDLDPLKKGNCCCL